MSEAFEPNCVKTALETATETSSCDVADADPDAPDAAIVEFKRESSPDEDTRISHIQQSITARQRRLAARKADLEYLAAIGNRELVDIYLSQISPHPLLTREEEVVLAKAIECGKEASEQLQHSYAETQPNLSELAEIQRRIQQAADARRRMIESNLRHVVTVAGQYQGGSLPILDLIQEGNLGLMHAVEKFDWRRGVKFSTYSRFWIRKYIERGIENKGRVVRLPVPVQERMRVVRSAEERCWLNLKRNPTIEEFAHEANMTPKEVEKVLQSRQVAVSIDAPIKEDSAQTFADKLVDPTAEQAVDESMTVEGELRKYGALQLLVNQVVNPWHREMLEVRTGVTPRKLKVKKHKAKPQPGKYLVAQTDVAAEFGITPKLLRRVEDAAEAQLRAYFTQQDAVLPDDM